MALAPVAADVPDLAGEGDVRPDAGRSREGDGEGYREGDGEAVLPGLRVMSEEVDTTVDGSLVAEDWVASGPVAGEGDGEGEGDGVGVPEEGNTWHTRSVFAVVASGAACAWPSRPRVRKLPLSRVTAATLTCAKRMRIACPRC